MIRCALLLFLLVPLAYAETAGDRLRSELASALAGATLIVPAGQYDGGFIIKHSVKLQGNPGAVLSGGGCGNVVTILAEDVEVSGFTIRDSGLNLSNDEAGVHISAPRVVVRDCRILNCLHGVYVRKATGVRIEGNEIIGASELVEPITPGTALTPASAETCTVELNQNRRGNGVHLWNSSEIDVIDNRIHGTRDGIYFSFTSQSRVRGNLISGVRYGLHYMYSDDNRFEDNVFTQNAAGSALMFSSGIVLLRNKFVANRSQRAYGLLLQSVDRSLIADNLIEGNTLGLFIENGNDDVVRNNRLVRNYIALRLSDSTATSMFAANTFAGNLHPVETNGLNTTNVWAEKGRGNYWTDGLKLDLNGDGVGDLPHREIDLFGTWRATFPAIGLLSASPGERLLRLVNERLVLPGIPAITDPSPLIRPGQ